MDPCPCAILFCSIEGLTSGQPVCLHAGYITIAAKAAYHRAVSS